MSYSFTDEQMKIIESDKKHLLIYGEAGCGKTPIMIKRIKHIVRKIKVNPKHILVCVHNLKEVTEIRNMLLKDNIDGVVVKTYEGLVLEILMHDGYIYPKYLMKDKYDSILNGIIKEVTVTKKTYQQYLNQPHVFPNYKAKIDDRLNTYLNEHHFIYHENLYQQVLKYIEKNEAILPYKHFIMDNTQYIYGELKEIINKMISDKAYVFVTGSNNQLLLDIELNRTLFHDCFNDQRFEKLKLFINYKNNLSVIKMADFIKYNKPIDTDKVQYVKQDHVKPDIKWFETELELLLHMRKHIEEHIDENNLDDCFIVVKDAKEASRIKEYFNIDVPIQQDELSDEVCDFLISNHFDEALSIKEQLGQYSDYFTDFPIDINQNATKEVLTDFYATLIIKQNEFQINNGIKIVYPHMMHGLTAKNIFVPFLHTLLSSHTEYNRRLLYSIIHVAKEFVSIYDLKEDANTHLHKEFEEIKNNWIDIRYKKAEGSQRTEIQSSLTSNDKVMFKRIEEGFNETPKLKNELLYLIKLTKEFDEQLNHNDKNYDIYMQAFRYFIQHTLKITFDVISETKKDRIASYLSGGSAGAFDIEKHMESFYRKGLDRCFTPAELKSIHDVYRYLSATHHKSDDFIKNKHDLKSAAYNIKVFRELSNHAKIKSYVSVIKFFDSLDLEDKKWKIIEQAIQ